MKALKAQQVAQTQRQHAVTNLYHARVEEAAALRRARGMGYRKQVFNRLQKALELDTPDKDRDRLRQEAVACLGDFVGLEPITWEGFIAGIRQIALTPDAEQMAIAMDNDTIELRSVSTGGVLATLNESAVDLGFDPANRWLVTATAKGTLRVWENFGIGESPATRTIEMHADLAGLARNGLFAVGRSQQKDARLLSLWNVASQEVKARLKVPAGEPVGQELVQVSDDGQWVAQAHARQGKLVALVWNTAVPEPKQIVFAETYQGTRALAISPDGKLLACSHGDDGLVLVDLHDSVPRPRIRSNTVTAAAFSRDGRFLVYCTLTGRVRLWSVTHHQEVAALTHDTERDEQGAFFATFSANGNAFASAVRASRSIRIWNLAGSGEELVLPGHDGGVACVAFSPDGKELASGSKDGFVKLWDTTRGRLLRTLPPFEYPIQSLAFSPDGRLLATGQFESRSQPVKVWDLRALQATAPPDDELRGWAPGVAFSPDGKYFAACGDGLTIWRLAGGENGLPTTPPAAFVRVVHLPGRRSLHVRISPNSKMLAWVDQNNLVCIWDLVSGARSRFWVRRSRRAGITSRSIPTATT